MSFKIQGNEGESHYINPAVKYWPKFWSQLCERQVTGWLLIAGVSTELGTGQDWDHGVHHLHWILIIPTNIFIIHSLIDGNKVGNDKFLFPRLNGKQQSEIIKNICTTTVISVSCMPSFAGLVVSEYIINNNLYPRYYCIIIIVQK